MALASALRVGFHVAVVSFNLFLLMGRQKPFVKLPVTLTQHVVHTFYNEIVILKALLWAFCSVRPVSVSIETRPRLKLRLGLKLRLRLGLILKLRLRLKFRLGLRLKLRQRLKSRLRLGLRLRLKIRLK